jgi:predicted RND superfamily exporter protein
MSAMKKLSIGLLMILGIASLIYAHNIEQKNPETIFLTEKSLEQYKIFQKDILEKHSLVIKREAADKEKFYQEMEAIDKICINDCEIITQRKLQKGRSSANPKNELMQLSSDVFEAALVLDNNDDIHKKILTYAESSPYWNDGKTSFAGIPYTNYLLDKYSLAIQEKLFPTMFVLGLIITIAFIGRIKNALVVYLPCLFSAGFSLATLKILYGQMNMVTSIIPLVVFTVTLSLSFHLYFSLMELKSLKAVAKIKWAPIFLMMFTTYIGFLSLSWAEISVIRTFGLVSSQLVLLATLFAFLWYYLWESVLLTGETHPKKAIFSSSIFNYSLKHVFIIVLSLLGILSVIFVPRRLDVITDATVYFPKETKIREKILEVTASVSGMPVMEIAVDLQHDLGQTDVAQMQEIEAAIEHLKLSQSYKIISNNALVRKINHEYSGNDILPDNIPGYLLLRGQLPASLQESYPVESKYRMTILGNPINVKEYMGDLKVIRDYLDSQKIVFQVNGIHHNLMVSQNSMIDVLAESFMSSAAIIFIFSAFFLRTVKNNLIFIFVTLLPVALTFGVIYFLGFSINIATVMTFSISLGLVGDSSFHIIYAKKVRFKNFEEYSRGVLFPVIGSGLLLCTCFAMFTFNSFMPIRQFGGILAIIMLLGTLVDLYILPTLLYGTDKHKKAYELQ